MQITGRHVGDDSSVTITACPGSTMENNQPAAWTTNHSQLVASCVRPFQEDRPITTRPYSEQSTWMVVRSDVISVFTLHTGNAPTSSDKPDKPPWLLPACLPTSITIPAPIQPTTAMTNYTHTPTVTDLSVFHAQL